ncbi:MAG: hypothetical protein CM1200mP39_27350 [Dehalococcoidia bacterium]|nr:MAG: hypothetical protein CM1200mP39_27350 [Dehalococcoidia bacterium]
MSSFLVKRNLARGATMSQTGYEASSIVEAYRQRTVGSAVLFEEACSLFPSGITHDSRF